jgi:HEAT repeat protein
MRILAPTMKRLRLQWWLWRLKSSTSRTREAACEALGKLGDPRAVPELLTRMGDGNENVSYEAREAILSLGTKAVKLLIGTLGDERSDSRWDACELLGEIGDQQAIEALIACLDDRDMQSSVFKSLENFIAGQRRRGTKLAHPRAVELLIAKLDPDPAFDWRWNVCSLLGEWGDRRAVPALIARLQDDDQNVRTWACKALRNLGDERAVEPLLTRLDLEDPESDVWSSALKALWHLTPGRPDLIQRLNDISAADTARIEARAKAVLLESKQSAGMPTPLPVQDSLDEAVRRLAEIYTANPDGFVRGQGTDREQEIRRIGQALHEQGGMGRMLTVHADFRRVCAVTGAGRNLEIIWDGIGEWRG